MSRKKTVKGKAATRSPSAGSPTGKWPGRAAKSSPGIVPMNGVVHPSRPSVSSSSEFYDIAFKVRRPSAPAVLPSTVFFHPLHQELAPGTVCASVPVATWSQRPQQGGGHGLLVEARWGPFSSEELLSPGLFVSSVSLMCCVFLTWSDQSRCLIFFFFALIIIVHQVCIK